MTFQAPKYLEPKRPVGTVAELFAGVGGFRIGLAQSGWKTVFSNQWEPSTKMQHASDVYVHNFGDSGHSNISVFEVSGIPERPDLVVGGFPCQDYSVAKARGTALGLEGKKGVLWWEIVRLLAENPVRFVLLENVDRLLKSPVSNRGRDFSIMLASFGMLGYKVEWRVINAAEYGFPQRRKRVFLFAERETGQKVNPSHEIFHSGVFARAFPTQPDNSGVALLELGSKPEIVSEKWQRGSFRGFPNAGLYVSGKVFMSEVSPAYDGKFQVLSDVLENPANVDSKFRVSEIEARKWQLAKGGVRIKRVSKTTGFEYVYSEGAMAFPDSVDKPSRTILTGEGGAAPSRFKHLIRDEIGYRRLVPTELERLFGFPDGWTSRGAELGEISDSRRAFLVGNALIVGLVASIGRAIAS